MLKLVGKVADLLGWLGWRSPMRSTALQALAGGIQGDPSAWLETGGRWHCFGACRAYSL
ncbi:hypothetical protein [Brucella anthropi]